MLGKPSIDEVVESVGAVPAVVFRDPEIVDIARTVAGGDFPGEPRPELITGDHGDDEVNWIKGLRGLAFEVDVSLGGWAGSEGGDVFEVPAFEDGLCVTRVAQIAGLGKCSQGGLIHLLCPAFDGAIVFLAVLTVGCVLDGVVPVFVRAEVSVFDSLDEVGIQRFVCDVGRIEPEFPRD